MYAVFGEYASLGADAILRRGVGFVARRDVAVPENATEPTSIQFQIPTWGLILLLATTVVFMAALTMVEYTFGRLIPTLAMVESPQAIIFEQISSEDPDAPLGEQKVEPDLMLVKQAPITSSFRSTIKHLRSKAGYLSRYRGFWPFILYTCVVQNLTSLISFINFIPTNVAPVLAAVLCAQISLAWTHVVISDPSPLRFFRRIPGFKSWRKVAGPTALLAMAEQLNVFLPKYLYIWYGLSDITMEGVRKLSCAERQVLVLKGISVMAFTVLLAFLIVFPSIVTLTRVQASLLPDSEETIVPFDRSFGGKVVPEIVGGSGVIGKLDAWKTFDWNARVRLIKAYAKAISLQLLVSVIFGAAIGAELMFMISRDNSNGVKIF